MKFDLQNQIDFYLFISILVLLCTGAFLRFFKYFFAPLTIEKMTLILVPETFIVNLVLLIFAIKIWRQ